MQCERLIKMIKSWYIHVRDETMAPARMISFIEDHAVSCDVCRQDPDLKEEISRITELVLPESKIPKAVRQKSGLDEDESEADEEIDTDDVIEDEEKKKKRKMILLTTTGKRRRILTSILMMKSELTL